MILPSHIPVPVSTAEQIRFGGDLGPRDIAFAIAVAHLAAVAGLDADNWYRVPDNRLRAELGQYRRETIEREDARGERLRAGELVHDTIGSLPLPAPASRNNRDDLLPWIVEPIVRELFEPEPESIMLPVEVLRECRNRHTATFVMRMLALLMLSPGEVKRSGRGFVHAAIKPGDLPRLLGLPPSSKPSAAMRDYLVPIMEDINRRTSIHLEVEAVHVRTASTPRGRVRHFEIFMSLPEESELERRFREREKAHHPRKGSWREKPTACERPIPRPRPTARPEGRDGVTNVSVLRPKFGQFRPPRRAPIAPDDGGDDVTF